jgi:arylsulfatase A-like enzyme
MHYPLQAPQEYIDKYMGKYDEGWETIRRQRYERQVAMGLLPPGLEPWSVPTAPGWDSLSDGERERRSKQMAVYAGMLDNMDHHIGRLWQYLRDIGEADNTVIVFMSDNGADNNEQEPLFPDYYRDNFDLSVERMGLPGTYANYGPNWANASSSPLTMFKGSGSEGGMRVPFIVHYPKSVQSGVTTDAFAYVTDITPTLLELAGVPQAEGNYRGREVHSPNGKSMLSLLQGTTDAVHGPDDEIAYELAGSAAVFRGDYKLMKNNPPFGDRQWRLYNFRTDPVEAVDLSAREPEMLREMQAAYDRYVEEFRLIEVPDDYHPLEQLQKNVARDRTIENVIGKSWDGHDGQLIPAASSLAHAEPRSTRPEGPR